MKQNSDFLIGYIFKQCELEPASDVICALRYCLSQIAYDADLSKDIFIELMLDGYDYAEEHSKIRGRKKFVFKSGEEHLSIDPELLS